MSKFGGYTVDGVPQKEEKNWGLQILVLLAVALIFVVPWVAVVVLIMHGHHATMSSAYHDRSTHASVALIAGIVVLDVVMLFVLAVRMVRRSSI